MYALGVLSIALGAAFLVLAVFMITETGFSTGFFGALATGGVGLAGGFNLIAQSKGLMD